jgi:lipopolysaccharide transport system ATP-binding protein
VIDEALAVGDVFFTQKCMRFLRRFMESGTVIFVSHDTAAVQNLCDRAILLEKGRVSFMGSAKDTAAEYLKSLYESLQGASAVPDAGHPADEAVGPAEPRDMRLDFLNCTQFRNDIEIFSFDPASAAFGKGGGRIDAVALHDRNGSPLTWVVGGEEVVLQVRCVATTDLHSPIVGFYVTDRLGQPLFGDNTYLTYRQAPLDVAAGSAVTARFAFRMPVLPAGDYSVTVALAEGTQHEHVQHHWLHDALVFKSHSSSVSQGLIGIPMRSIEMAVAGR